MAAEREQQIQRLSQEVALSKTESARLGKALHASSIEKEELQCALESAAKESELLLGETEKRRSQLEAQVQDLQRQVESAAAQYDNLTRAHEATRREMALKLQDDFGAARQECQIVARRLEDTTKELGECKRENEDLFQQLERSKQSGRTLQENCKRTSDECAKLKEAGKTLEGQLNSLKSASLECGLRLKHLDEERRRAEAEAECAVRERDSLVDKFNGYGEQLQKANAETVQSLLGRHKTKRDRLRKKVVELKSVIGGLESELAKQKKTIAEMKSSYEGTVAGLHADMKRVKEEWERRVCEQDQDCQRRVAEEQARLAQQVAQLQEQYQQMLDAKLVEIQSEAQSQITQTATSQLEMKSLFESKMHSIDKSHISLARHEESMEEERRKAKEIMEKAVASVREEMGKKIQESEIKYVREAERAEKVHQENIAGLEESLRKAREEAKALDEKLALTRTDKDSTERDAKKLEKEKKRLMERLVGSESKCAELEKAIATLKQAERAAKESASTLSAKLEQTSAAGQILQTSCEVMKQKLAAVMAESGNCAEATKASKEEKSALQDSVRRLEQEKCELARKLQQQAEDLANESRLLHNRTQELNQHEREKLEKEIREHTATKNALAQIKEKLTKRDREVADLKTKLEETGRQSSQLEGMLSAARGQTYEMQSENQLIVLELQTISQQHRELTETHNTMRTLVQRQLLDSAFKMKEAIQNLKGSLIAEMGDAQKELIKRLGNAVIMQQKHDLAAEKRLGESIRQNREEVLRVFREDVGKSPGANGKYELMIREKSADMQRLQTVCEELEKRNKQMCTQLGEVQGKMAEHRAEQGKLERENDRLRREVKSNAEKLGSLRSEAKEQTARLKADAQSALSEAKRDLEQKHKQQLAGLQKQIETIKFDSSKELSGVLSDVGNLKAQHQYETQQLIQGYETSLIQAESSFRTERDQVEKLRLENDRLQQELENSKEEQKSQVGQLETKVKKLGQSMADDGDRYRKMKSDKGDEVEMLNRKVRDLSSELMLKAEVVEELTMERESLRAKLRDATIRVELQQEKTSHARGPSRDIDDLLSRSYNSVSSSVGKSRKSKSRIPGQGKGNPMTSKTGERSPLTVSQLAGSPKASK